MTAPAPALVWVDYDPDVAPTRCSLGHCDARPVAMRGPRSALIKLRWRAYCHAHALLYGGRDNRERLVLGRR